ncbi:hypothetical protein IW140_001770 [Coemansia sp. RSA 1813]|nr:hypothetical protein EV178_002983 [Coemansia sp. RSA 1646]KAJ1769184.1 hypothetical protein LPJ74_004245 [Coemansia sp. RSA 1843]KAJ2090858.1 hypothetical protein IW138_002261 [Coemansia sp. RSA 986]KAJ2213197.1 hypothetical protein EV179_004072 [Coemansia sp. RSA 487]KAJ2571315.1 hypothetical protein IW140_001770 [Coemansia sp. RSA 1813]
MSYNYPGSYDNYGQQQGGYDNYGQQQGGYDNYGQQQGGYNQPQGGQQQSDFDISGFTGNESTEEIARMMMGGSANSDVINNIGAYEEKARALPDEDFNMNEFYSKYGGVSGDADRGIFGFGSGNNFQGESKTSHQLLGGAAAWAALNWYQNKSRNQGKKVSHSFAKKLLVAFAASQAVKYWEKNSASFQNGLTRDLVVEEATRTATQVANVEYPDYDTGYTYNSAGKGGEANSFDASFNNNAGNNYQGNYYNGQQGHGNPPPSQQYYGGGGY